MTAPPDLTPASAPPASPSAAGTPPAGAGSSTFRRSGPRPAATRRRLRLLAGFTALLVGYGVLAAVLGGNSAGEGGLDPASAEPGGTMAIANLLRDRGVTVTTSSDTLTVIGGRLDKAGTPDPDQTVVVVHPGLLDTAALRSLGALVEAGGDVVLVAPDAAVVDALRIPVQAVDPTGSTSSSPDCPLPEAVTADTADLSPVQLYAPPTDTPASGQDTVTFCYPESSTAAALAVMTPRGTDGRLTLLGGSAFLTNGRLASDGDAALALGLLTRHDNVAWVLQAPTAPDPVEGKSLFDLLGRWFWLTFLQLVVALVLLALWRGRRLGPPVPEPLPVVARASETTAGHGRLYAAARARETAAEALRAGLRYRLADRLGLPTAAPGSAPAQAGPRGASGGPDPAALIASVAERTRRPAGEIGALLYGSGGPWTPPRTPWAAAGPWHPADGTAPRLALDDSALIRLAEALDDLDRQVGGR